jgi:predicted SnoaL-like aldol condensation-catalyzing enzyme
MEKIIPIENPLLVVFKNGDGDIETHIHSADMRYEEYGIVIADVVRHVANAFKVSEWDVFEWVNKEIDHQTSPIVEIKPN